MLQEPLFLLQAILEDAAEHPLKDLWVVLADVQAAFDSVGPGSKALTMRAAGLPESAINLIIDADDSASISVITPAAGISDPFPAQQGYRQGDPFSVLGWLLFINPLLVWLADGLPATAPTVNHTPSDPIQQKHNGTHLRCDNPPMEGCYQLSHSSTRQPSLTFIDDGACATSTFPGLVTYLERSSRYLEFHNVHAHPIKTVFTRRPPSTAGTQCTPPGPSRLHPRHMGAYRIYTSLCTLQIPWYPLHS